MRTSHGIAAVLTVTLCSTAQALMPNLVKDSGFEEPALAATSHQWRDFLAGEKISEWEVMSGGGSVSIHLNRVANLGLYGGRGLQHVDIGRDAGIKQDITGLISGRTYTLRFDYALHDSASANSELAVRVGSLNTLLPISNKGSSEWKTAEYTFQAGATTEPLTFFENKASTGAGSLIDSVVIREAPLVVRSANPTTKPSRYTIEAGAEVTIKSEPGYSGALFQVSSGNFQRCQFDNPMTYGDAAKPMERTTFFQSNIIGRNGLTLKMRPVWPDQNEQLGGIGRFYPNSSYQFIYGDYNSADIRFVTSELCRRNLGRFILDVKPQGTDCDISADSDEPTIIDLSSIPVTLSDSIEVQSGETGGSLINVSRENYLECRNAGQTRFVGDFAEGADNKLTMVITSFPFPEFVPYKAGETFYFIKVDNMTPDAVSESCRNGARFSVRVNQ